MKIINMNDLNDEQRLQAAKILHYEIPLGWQTLDVAIKEVNERIVPENVMLAAIENDVVLGWGGILEPTYNGNVYELHPLAVRGDVQRKGIGAALVLALEDAARKKGGLVIWLGADDEKPGGETSLAFADLFDSLPEKLLNFSAGTHQAAFYIKQGYKIIGVMPDANGIGKPDIFLAKKLH